MTNIIEVQENLKDLPDQTLIQEMRMPTGNAPQFLVLSELKRRKRMRDDYQRRENADMKTVAEEAVTAAGVPQEGIMGVAKNMAPKTNVAQNTGMAQAMPVTPTQAPQPQMMADGGIMKLRKGRKLGRPVEYAGETYMVTDRGEVFLNNRRVANRDLISAVLSEAQPEVMTEAPTLGSEALSGAQPDEATSISRINLDAITPQAPTQQLTSEDLMTSSTAYSPNMLFRRPSIAGIGDDIYRQRAASEIAGTALRDLRVADEEAAKVREAGLAQFGEKRTEVEEAPRAIGTVGFGIDQLTERDRLLRQQGIDRRSEGELALEAAKENEIEAAREAGLAQLGNLNVPMGYLGSGNIAGPQYYLDETGNVKPTDYSYGEYRGGGRNKLSGTSASRDANARVMIRDYFEDKEEYDKILGNEVGGFEVGTSDAKREDYDNEYMKSYDEYFQYQPDTGFQLTDEQVNEKFKSRFDGKADAPIRGTADLAQEAYNLDRYLASQRMPEGQPGGTTLADTRIMNMLNTQRAEEEQAAREEQQNAITASLAANQAGYEAAAFPEAPEKETLSFGDMYEGITSNLVKSIENVPDLLEYIKREPGGRETATLMSEDPAGIGGDTFTDFPKTDAEKAAAEAEKKEKEITKLLNNNNNIPSVVGGASSATAQEAAAQKGLNTDQWLAIAAIGAGLSSGRPDDVGKSVKAGLGYLQKSKQGKMAYDARMKEIASRERIAAIRGSQTGLTLNARRAKFFQDRASDLLIQSQMMDDGLEKQRTLEQIDILNEAAMRLMGGDVVVKDGSVLSGKPVETKI
jgi:hypothetical protein